MYRNLVLIITLSCLVGLGSGQTNPFHITLGHHPVIRSNVGIHGEKADDDQTSLSIENSDTGVNILINSESSIVARLSQAVPEDLSVILEINSDGQLVSFDNDTDLQPIGNNSREFSYTWPADVAGEKIFKYKTLNVPGHAEVVLKLNKRPASHDVDLTQAFLSINISRNTTLDVIILFLGWGYFAAWATSFYPQLVLNFQRKSVQGLSFLFLLLNLIGFASYSLYNIFLMYSHEVREEYYNRYSYSRIPVELNDVFFSVHASIITAITIGQYFVYYNREERTLYYQIGIVGCLVLLIEGVPCLLSLFNVITILDVLFVLSTVKLVITLVKYIPQAYLNYKRKSTEGWSVVNILLDLTGGLLSLAQMFFLAYNYNDWIAIFGNFTKFGLALASMGFDILFIVQHYVLYRNIPGEQEDLTAEP